MCVDLTQKYDPKHMKNIPYTARLSPVHITSHHIEETDAGRDRPLYLRNKLYDKTLKSQNYYSNSCAYVLACVFWQLSLLYRLSPITQQQQLITLNFLSVFFLFLYVSNIFFCHCSVCLVLWASLPEIKIDDDDDDDILWTAVHWNLTDLLFWSE